MSTLNLMIGIKNPITFLFELQGALIPCLSAAVATWCPLTERDRFISFAVQGELNSTTYIMQFFYIFNVCDSFNK